MASCRRRSIRKVKKRCLRQMLETVSEYPNRPRPRRSSPSATAWAASTELATARALLEGSGRLDGRFTFMNVDALLSLGDRVGAIRELRRGVEAYRRSGALSFASTLLGLLAVLLLEGGHDELAEQSINEADFVTSPHDAVSVALVAAARAILASRHGDHDKARSLSEGALEVIDSTDMIMNRGNFYRWLSEVPRRRGDIAEQRRMLAEALRLYQAKGHLTFANLAADMLAELA